MKKRGLRATIFPRFLPTTHPTDSRPITLQLLKPFLPIERFTRHDRAVALAMWLVGVVQGFSQAHPSATLPFTRAGLGMSEADMSALLALARLASFLAIGLSVWGDRRGRRRPILFAYLLLVTATGASAFAVAPWQFGLTQSLVRVAVSALSALGVVWLAEHLSPHVRAYGVSLYGAAGSLGAGAALLALPLAEQNWRLPYGLSLAGLLLLPVLFRRLEESPLIPELNTQRFNLRRSLGDQKFVLASIAGLLPAAFSAVGLSFSTERMVGSLGLSTGTAVALTLGGGTIGGVGFFLGGRLSDGWGRRPTTVLALSCIGTGGLGLYHFSEPLPLFLAVVVSSFGSFAYIPAAATHRAELFPTETRATATTTLTWTATLGSAAGLTAGRLLIDRIGLTGTMDVLGIGVVIGMSLTLLLPETKGRELSAEFGARSAET
jgi:MFS family permease